MVATKPCVPHGGKFPFSIPSVSLCSFVFFIVLYLLVIIHLPSASIFKRMSCSRSKHHQHTLNPDFQGDYGNMTSSSDDDRFEFNSDDCNVENGRWVFNNSTTPLYTDSTCPYLDTQFSCVRNGRLDSEYIHWEWQPEDCILPRFNPKLALQKIRGKRVMFVGDSLQRGQWQSFICMVASVIPDNQKSMQRRPLHATFTAREYNATIEFNWAPFLVESNSDRKIIADPKKRILRVDTVAKHAENWIGVDVLVFSTYVWWMSGTKINSLWGSFPNGEEGYEELDAPVAYRLALKTWANWIDSNVDPNKTRVFFTTMSPTHVRSADWGKKDGLKCYNETKPVMKKWYWGSGSDKSIMDVVVSVLARMKVPVTVLNITQLSEYRIDGHASVYTETQGKLLTDEQKADPLHYADCIHWCLPGVPDTWNQLFLAYL